MTESGYRCKKNATTCRGIEQNCNSMNITSLHGKQQIRETEVENLANSILSIYPKDRPWFEFEVKKLLSLPTGFYKPSQI